MNPRYCLVLLFALICLGFVQSQNIITHSLNGMRSGDTFFKQQIEYKDPGRRGENVIWDFSKLKVTNDKYSISYFEPVRKDKDTVFITGIEHNTMYKYGLTGDSLFLQGFENSGSQLNLNKPELNLVYPFAYGDSIVSSYNGSGRYMNMVLTHADGTISTIADAIGTLILPDGDTLVNVIRVKSEKCYRQQTIPVVYEDEMRLCKTDTVIIEDINEEYLLNEPVINSKKTVIENAGKSLIKQLGLNDPEKNESNISSNLNTSDNHKRNSMTRGQMIQEKTDSIFFRTETCRWYAPGYRYPLFETICNKSHQSLKDTTEIKDVATAFYCPPSMHTYLENDPENIAIKDSLLAAKETKIALTDSLLFSYNYYPNPVKTVLNVELLLDFLSEVSFRIVDATGKIVLTTDEGLLSAGVHCFTIKVNKLYFGNYVLHIIVGKQKANAILLKV